MEAKEEAAFLPPGEAWPTSPHSRRKQALATLCATLGCLLNGAVIGYTGPAIPSMMNSTGSLGGGSNLWGDPLVLDAQQASWITGLLSIGCFCGCLLAGPCLQYLGRRFTLMVVASSSYLLSFMAIMFASSAGLVFVGRFLGGLGLGVVLATTSVYIVEIATVDMRGPLGCFVQFLGGFGVLASFTLGALLNWWQLAAALIAFIPPFIIAMYIAPESPRWLFSKGREEEGRAALAWLRGAECPALAAEVDQIKAELEESARDRITVRDLLEPAILRPFLIAATMYAILNLAGLNIMIFYCNSIFQYSGSSLHYNVNSIIVAIVLLVSSLVAISIITRLPRKVILVTSIAGMAVCYAILGACFHSIEKGWVEARKVSEQGSALVPPDPGHAGWVAPLAIILLLFLGNGGYGTLIWVVMAELLPPRVRATANAVVICLGFILGFIMSKTFVDLVGAVGASGTFWLYGGVCAAGAAFTAYYVPETRGRSIEEIQRLFAPRPAQL